MPIIVPSTHKSMQAMFQHPTSTAADWATRNPVIVERVMTYESDTGILKMGDGVTPYNDLTPIFEKTLSAAEKALLVNANLAGGVLVLDENGKIPLDNLPEQLRGSVKMVNDIALRDALTGDDLTGVVFVVDASADPTVTAGSAMYIWSVPDGGGAETWVKFAEVESLDVSLVNFFDKSINTLDDLNDGVNFVRMSVAEQTKLAGIEALADVTDAENVEAAGAVMLNHILVVDGGDHTAFDDFV